MEPLYIDKPLFQTMFGICVREARETKSLNLAQIKLMTGISIARLEQIESGKGWVRQATREKLMEALEISKAHEEKLINVARVAFIDELMRIWHTPEPVEQGL